MPPLVEYADEQEERPGRESVIELLEDTAGKAMRRQREDTQRTKSQVADGAVRNQLLHVLLHHADQRTVQNADHRNDQHDRRNFVASRRVLWEQRQRETDESVCSHLQQNAGQDDGAGRRRFGVRVRQPRMEREHRHLDRKREEKGPEQDDLRARVKLRRRCQQRGDVKRHAARLEVERQDPQQHQHRTDERIQEKLDRGVQAAVTAPHADQEINRNKHHFPEHVEQEEVERHENAQHPYLEQQEENVIFLRSYLDRAPGRQDRDRPQQ